MPLYLATWISFLNTGAIKGSRIALTLYALYLGANAFEIGLLVSTYGVVPMLVASWAGRVSDRFGVRRPMMFASVAMTVGMLVPLLAPSLWLLAVCGTVIGTANIFFHVSAQNLVGNLGDETRRTANFSTFSLGGSLSGVAGPVMVGFVIEHFGYLHSFAALAIMSILPAVTIVTAPNFIPAMTRRMKEAVQVRTRDLVTIKPLRNALIASGLILTGLDLFNFYMPIYGRSIGLSASTIGIIVGAQAAAAFVVRIFMPWSVNRLGEVRVMFISLILSGLTYLLFPMVEHAVLLTVISFLLGLGLGCGQPLSTIMTYSHAPAGRGGEALGLRLAVNKFTQSLVPLVFGSLGGVFGLAPIFAANAALLIAGAFVAARPVPGAKPASS